MGCRLVDDTDYWDASRSILAGVWEPPGLSATAYDLALMRRYRQLGDDLWCALDAQYSCATLDRALRLVQPPAAEAEPGTQTQCFTMPVDEDEGCSALSTPEVVLYASATLPSQRLRSGLLLRSAFGAEGQLQPTDSRPLINTIKCSRTENSGIDHCLIFEGSSLSSRMTVMNLHITVSATHGGLGFLRAKTATVQVLNSALFGFSARNGGAISAEDAALSIANSTFSDNLAIESGGAIATEGGSLVVSGSSFHGNTAGSSGGAVYVSFTTCDITDSSFSLNAVSHEATGGGSELIQQTSGGGGAVFCGGSRTITITNCGFQLNQAEKRAGEFGIVRGGALRTLACAVIMNGSDFTLNRAGIGGAGYFEVPILVTAINSTFLNNTAAASAGAVEVFAAERMLFQQVTIEGNAAEGGAGGGINIINPASAVVLDSCLVTNNSAQGIQDAFGGGLALFNGDRGLANGVLAPLYLLNSVLHSNIAGTAGGAVYWQGFLQAPVLAVQQSNSTNALTVDNFLQTLEPICSDEETGETEDEWLCFEPLELPGHGNLAGYGATFATEPRRLLYQPGTSKAGSGLGHLYGSTISLVDFYGQTVTHGSASRQTINIQSFARGPEQQNFTESNRGFLARLHSGSADLSNFTIVVPPRGFADLNLKVEYSTAMAFLSSLQEEDGELYAAHDRYLSQPCRPGTYVNREQCSPCASGAISGYDADSCTKCPAGYYSTNSNSACHRCPDMCYSGEGKRLLPAAR